MRVFTVDVLIHQGRLTEAYQELTHTLATLDRNPSHHAPLPLATTLLTTHLKLASVHYALNNLSVSLLYTVYIVSFCQCLWVVSEKFLQALNIHNISQA